MMACKEGCLRCQVMEIALKCMPVANGQIILVDIHGPHTIEAAAEHEDELVNLFAVDKNICFEIERHDGLVFITLEEV